MQSAALFPLTLLFALPSGLLWFHMSLEVIAGVSTYFLASALSLPIVIATGVGVLFALNGTFSWLGNAVLNPVAFLPMLVLGIEMIYDARRARRRKGWYVAAIALALSLYAGFPEVAYFDGLFCAGWADRAILLDLPKEFRLVAARPPRARRAASGSLLSLPILVPFYDFYEGRQHRHARHRRRTRNVHLSLTRVDVLRPLRLRPHLREPQRAANAWGAIGGYFTFSVDRARACSASSAERLRPLTDLPRAVGVHRHPRQSSTSSTCEVCGTSSRCVKSRDLPRYMMPSCELALSCSPGSASWTSRRAVAPRGSSPRRPPSRCSLLLWGALDGEHAWNDGLVHATRRAIVYMFLDSLPFIAAFALLVLGRLSFLKIAPARWCTILVVGESLVMFAVPTAGRPSRSTSTWRRSTTCRRTRASERFLDLAVLPPTGAPSTA